MIPINNQTNLNVKLPQWIPVPLTDNNSSNRSPSPKTRSMSSVWCALAWIWKLSTMRWWWDTLAFTSGSRRTQVTDLPSSSMSSSMPFKSLICLLFAPAKTSTWLCSSKEYRCPYLPQISKVYSKLSAEEISPKSFLTRSWKVFWKLSTLTISLSWLG